MYILFDHKNQIIFMWPLFITGVLITLSATLSVFLWTMGCNYITIYFTTIIQ